MELDPRLTDIEAASFVAQLNRAAHGSPIGREAGVEAVRTALHIPRDPDTAEVTSRDVTIDIGDRRLPIRLYIPADHIAGTILFFHGGGWMLGDLDTNDTLCRDLCRKVGASVVSVDYRLAPEHPYPAAIVDGVDALHWVAAGADGDLPGTNQIALAGHSAGGNIAAVLAQLAASGEAPTVVHQLLMCAVLDCDTTRASYRENGDGLLLTTAEMQWYWDLYVPDERCRVEPAASPLRRADLSGIAPATLVIAGGDPLRDEEVEYGLRLKNAGVPVHTCFVAGVPHLFLTFPVMASRTRAIDEASRVLRLSLASGRKAEDISGDDLGFLE